MNMTPSLCKRWAGLLTVIALLSGGLSTLYAQTPPKREFRGVWIQTVGPHHYADMNEDQIKARFTHMLDSLQHIGINAVLFQVRPEADAWYRSAYEPWSRSLTGVSDKNPGWDPLAFMVDECHRRNIDIHAWINPYRVRMTATQADMNDPFIRKHRSWIVRYGKSLWFDPGMPECRAHIVKVVRQLVSDYDVDGLHMDDYFYPYPVAGRVFADDASYARYNPEALSRDDWRRDNVDRLVAALREAIREPKPWVQFGVSPFGIYRNIGQDPDGSQTDGLSNYDDLYADALLWMREGWIDYCIPQLYWEIAHMQADYRVLINWWAGHTEGTPVYIGQEAERSMHPRTQNIPSGLRKSLSGEQLTAKMDLQRGFPALGGNCWFSAYSLLDNPGAQTLLQGRYYAEPALLPAFSPDTVRYVPQAVEGLKVVKDSRYGQCFEWKSPRVKDEMLRPSYYVVYRFKSTEPVVLSDPRHIMAITKGCFYPVPHPHPEKGDWIYVVTAVSRLHEESPGVSVTIRIK